MTSPLQDAGPWESTHGPALLEIDHMSKRFGQVIIAEDLSLTVGPGDMVGIVGPNGAGKTSLFEAAHAALTTVSDPHDKAEVADAIHKVNLPQAVAGPLNFASGGPAPGVAITPPVGIQWQKGTKFPVEAQVVDNTLQPQAKITADLQPTNT